MIVCYVGPYRPDYPRNRVIIKGLKKNNVRIIECNSRCKSRIFDYSIILIKLLKLRFDVVILGSRGEHYNQALVPLIKCLTRKPLIFDAVITAHETKVLDRKIVKETSIKSIFWHLFDHIALTLSDVILTDTIVHAKYYSNIHKIDFKKFRRLFVGSDEDSFYPREKKTDSEHFLVLFWGGFIPLQGVKIIIKAAKLLEKNIDIKFELRGYGQTYKRDFELAKKMGLTNVVFIPELVPYDELPVYIARADVCLGVFGDTEKARHVISNKAVETLAMGKPLITGDSIASRELLTNKENCLLVPLANPDALAEAILLLKNDGRLIKKIAQNGHLLFKEKLSSIAIGKELKSDILEPLQSSLNRYG